MRIWSITVLFFAMLGLSCGGSQPSSPIETYKTYVKAYKAKDTTSMKVLLSDATMKPFRALRPTPETAKQVSCVPYDVMYESEVNSSIASEPISFLRVTRSEGDFPAGADPSSKEIFAKARENLQWFIDNGIYQT